MLFHSSNNHVEPVTFVVVLLSALVAGIFIGFLTVQSNRYFFGPHWPPQISNSTAMDLEAGIAEPPPAYFVPHRGGDGEGGVGRRPVRGGSLPGYATDDDANRRLPGYVLDPPGVEEGELLGRLVAGRDWGYDADSEGDDWEGEEIGGDSDRYGTVRDGIAAPTPLPEQLHLQPDIAMVINEQNPWANNEVGEIVG
jgi:hypothetical protein